MIQWLRLAAEATGRHRVNCIPAASMLILAFRACHRLWKSTRRRRGSASPARLGRPGRAIRRTRFQ